MCGIAGALSSASTSQLEERVRAALAAQVHRGPDSEGLHVADGVALGIRRLRVIDLETGDQPVYNEDGSVAVVLNGEIYNYRELRRELLAGGHTLATAGDAEVIAHLYEELGDDCIDRLAGMFAFALWDSGRRRLLVARDRVGKKPLHYHHAADGSLTFASELQALMRTGAVGSGLDLASLDTYLAYGYVQAPFTIYGGARKLPPAHKLTWCDGGLTVSRYWRLGYEPKTGRRELPEVEAELRDLVGAAVRRRMIADVPLGAFLSGGVDSSIVVSEMAFHSPDPVKTFSIGFGSGAYDELPAARTVAERFGTDHTELVVEPDAVALLPKLVHHYGEPFADSSAIPSFYLAEMTRRQVTVALNGDGGDESFAGYLRTAADARTMWLDGVPAGLRRAVAVGAGRALSPAERRSGGDYVRRFLTALPLGAAQRYAAHVGIFGARERERLLSGEAASAVDPARTAAVIAAPWGDAERAGLGNVDKLLAVDVASYLPGDLLTKVDIATMAHSLEARSPLLDPSVMEFAARLPARYKLHGREKKWLLRRAYRWAVPGEILDGPKKGFGVPLGEWFRGPLAGHVRDVLCDPGVGGGLLDPAAVTELVDAHQARTADNSARIWALLFLEHWRVSRDVA